MTVRVGVIGGGQLARMMIAPAVEIGLDIRVLAEDEGMSAQLAATAVGDYRDLETVRDFARDVDVITFDHEHVPQGVLRALVADGIQVHPGPDALQYAQDKLVMRARLAELDVPQPEWAPVRDAGELQRFIDEHGGGAVVKTPRGGYDGKGVRVVRSGSDAADWFASAGGEALLAEELVSFRRELAQAPGDARVHPPANPQHKRSCAGAARVVHEELRAPGDLCRHIEARINAQFGSNAMLISMQS